MFTRLVKNKKILICGLLTEIAGNPDQIKDYKSLRGLHLEDGWERVRLIFSKDAYGDLHPEMVNTIQLAQLGFFTGAILGGTLGSKKAVDDFLKNNDASLFFTNKDAHKKLSATSIIGFGKGSLKMAPYFSIFLSGFYLFSACCEAYRNKSGIVEYSFGAAVTGAACRFTYGIRGLISGGIVGGVLGTIFGIMYVGIQKVLGVEATELKYAHYALKKYRDRLKAESIHTSTEEIKTHATSHLVRHIQDPLESLPGDEIKEKEKNPMQNERTSK